MTTSLILLTATSAIVLIKLAQLLYKRFKFVEIVDKIPGPKAYPIFGNALTLLRINRNDQYMWLRDICSQYKEGIFRIWIGMQPRVYLTTAETVSVIMTSKNIIAKSSVYDFLHPWLGAGLVTATGEKWHRHRNLITPTFHVNILEKFVAIMSEKAEVLIECMASKLKNNPENPLDMFNLLTNCALDIICESAMGININAQTNPNAEYSVALHSMTGRAVERMFRPWIHPDWIYYRTSRGKRFKNNVEIAHKFTNQVNLLEACDRESMPLTDDELRDEVNTFMFAGHDTTSAAMSWALFCIGNYPEVEKRIHQEQLQVFGDSRGPATLHQLSELKYLERVIKESLRLFPSAPMIARNVTEDLEIAGYKIPKGAVLSMQIHQVHRDPKYWPEPEQFDPDRFLPKNSRGRHPYAYVPFSAGPRNCIGQKFSYFEQKTILTAVLRTWRVKSLLKFNEAKCYNEFILRPQDGTKICFTCE